MNSQSSLLHSERKRQGPHSGLGLLVIAVFCLHCDLALAETTGKCAEVAPCFEWLTENLVNASPADIERLCEAGTTVLRNGGDAGWESARTLLMSDNSRSRALSGCLVSRDPVLEERAVRYLDEQLSKGSRSNAADALARIGTPSALFALFHQMSRELNDPGSLRQAYKALSGIGPSLIPTLYEFMVAHADDYRLCNYAASMLWTMKEAPLAYVAEWEKIALDPREGDARRVAAIVAIAHIEESVAPKHLPITPLLEDRNETIRFRAISLLTNQHDERVIPALVASCPFSSPGEDALSWEGICLNDAASFGEALVPHLAIIRQHLEHGGPIGQATAAVTLGLMGDQVAVPELIRKLESDDWRVAFASARSLGWLRAESALPALESTSRDHWFSLVRSTAAESIHWIRNGGGPIYSPKDAGYRPVSGSAYDFDSHPFDDLDGRCDGDLWATSHGEVRVPQFSLGPLSPDRVDLEKIPGLDHLSAVVDVPQGRLISTDRGEFGGHLYFQAAGVDFRTDILEDHISTVFDMQPWGDGALAGLGMVHMSLNSGYVVEISRNRSGDFVARRRFETPGAPLRLTPLEDGAVLIRTLVGAYLLDHDWRPEEARCAVARS